MQRHGNQLLYSPSDLGNFVACEHLTQLEIAAVLGESTRPYFSNAYVDLIARKGEEHEKNFLEALRAEGHEVAEVGLGDDRSFAAAAETTAAAMRAGAKYIYQAVFLERRLAWDRRFLGTNRSTLCAGQLELSGPRYQACPPSAARARASALFL